MDLSPGRGVSAPVAAVISSFSFIVTSNRNANIALNNNDARSALRYARELAEDRQQARILLPPAPIVDSDDETDSPCPVFDVFAQSLGPEGLAWLTNFSAREFNGLWCDIAEDVLLSWNVGRGRRCKVTPKDVLFMVVVVLKVGGTWDALAAMFKMKGPTFEKMIVKFMVILEPIVYELYVAKPASELTMKKLHLSGQSFRNFPEVYYATDVTFQQCNRPSGNMQEGQVYFSGKHKLYGLKVEVSVPKKESLPSRPLSRADDSTDRLMSSDRIIVEDYFGRLCTLWSVVSHKSRWAESSYNTIFRTCIALTNLHVTTSPLRADTNDYAALYTTHRDHLYAMGKEIYTKRRRAQAKYRAKRRIRLEHSVHGTVGDDGFDE